MLEVYSNLNHIPTDISTRDKIFKRRIESIICESILISNDVIVDSNWQQNQFDLKELRH